MKQENFGGGVTLYNCDCRELVSAANAPFVFLDPPFNIYGEITQKEPCQKRVEVES